MLKSSFKLHVVVFTIAMLLASCNINDANSKQLPASINPESYKQIQSLFDCVDYHWDTMHRGVPDIELQSFPADIGLMHNVQQKKHLFFMSLLPMVISQNNKIVKQRQILQQIFIKYDQLGKLTNKQNQWLIKLGKQYRCAVEPLNNSTVRQKLLRRVDTVPAALVIAQAANESAYGSSRFSQQGNNIFGEWTFTPGTGLVPLDRADGHTYEVRVFNTLRDSIQSYFNNLNTHTAYKQLRAIREMMRTNDQPLAAQKLAEGLINYSTRRGEYVAEIQTMINYNRLSRLSELELRNGTTQLAQHQILHMSQLCSRELIHKKNIL